MEIKFNGVNVGLSDEGTFTAMTDEGVKIGDVLFVQRRNYFDVYHTQIEPEWEGQGMAGKMTQAVLELARKYNLKIYPHCPYMSKYLNNHQEYKDLVYV